MYIFLYFSDHCDLQHLAEVTKTWYVLQLVIIHLHTKCRGESQKGEKILKSIFAYMLQWSNWGQKYWIQSIDWKLSSLQMWWKMATYFWSYLVKLTSPKWTFLQSLWPWNLVIITRTLYMLEFVYIHLHAKFDENWSKTFEVILYTSPKCILFQSLWPWKLGPGHKNL